MRVVTTISLMPQELNTLQEIIKLEKPNLPRKSVSAAVGFLIRYYAEHKAGEFKPLPPDAARKEADKLEKAAIWYRLQAEADEQAAREEITPVLQK